MLNEEEFSSDSDDEDYVPQGVSASEEEDSGEDESLIYQEEEIRNNKDNELKRKNMKIDKKKRKSTKIFENDNKSDINMENKNESLDIPSKGKTDKLWDDFLKDTVTARPSSKINSDVSSKGKIIEESNFGNTQNAEGDKVNLSIPVDSNNKTTNVSNFSNSDNSHLNVENSDGKNIHPNSGNSINSIPNNAGNSVNSTPNNCNQISLKAIPPKLIPSLNNQSSNKVGGGLSSVLNKINKKPKINILEKSKLDWQSFTKAEGIQEDLKKHNIGKQGYIERMSFLQRTDQKQFEIERDFRLANMKRS